MGPPWGPAPSTQHWALLPSCVTSPDRSGVTDGAGNPHQRSSSPQKVSFLSSGIPSACGPAIASHRCWGHTVTTHLETLPARPPWPPAPPRAHQVHPLCTLPRHPAWHHGSAQLDCGTGEGLTLLPSPRAGLPKRILCSRAPTPAQCGITRAGPASTALCSRGLQTPSKRHTEHRPLPPAVECEHLEQAPAAPEKQVRSGSSQQTHKCFCVPGHCPSAAAAAAAKCPRGANTPRKTSDRYQPFRRPRGSSSLWAPFGAVPLWSGWHRPCTGGSSAQLGHTVQESILLPGPA